MPYTWIPGKTKQKHKTHVNLMAPVNSVFPDITPLLSGCNRPLKMSFEDQLNILVYYHLEEHRSGRHLLQVLKEEHFARQHIAPEGGIEKSSFFEDISSRGLPQMMEMFGKLYASAAKHLPRGHAELGNLVLIDGSLIDAVLSMYWADYRKGSKKAKVHVGFDLNLGIPKKIFLSDGKEAERPFVEKILAPGETGVMDRGYQSHKLFDAWQADDKSFICRIKASTEKTVIKMNDIQPGSIVFYDAVVLLGTQGANRTEREVRLVGYQVGNVNYWIATNRHDLTAEQIAFAYKLRWNIGVSREGRIIQSVKVRPRLKDSGPRSLEGAVARKQDGEALRQHSLKGGCATYQVVTYSERRRSLVTRIPVAETVYDVRRQQEMAVMSQIRHLSPAGYQRRHGTKDHAETGEALDARRRNLDEEFRPITLNGKWREWRQGGGSGRSTVDLCAAKRTGKEGPGPVVIPFGNARQG